MSDSPLPFFVDGRRVGMVHDVSPRAGFFRGRLSLHSCDELAIFESVVALARAVDTAPSAELQSAWEAWRRGCGELEELHLWIGDANSKIEQFTIESDWSIEWQNAFEDSLGL